MQLLFSNDPEHYIEYFDVFLGIVGAERWFKRSEQLFQNGNLGAADWKILSDFHWLELEISSLIHLYRTKRKLESDELDNRSWAALHFVKMVSEVYLHSRKRGKRALRGKLLDALKTKFSSLFQELEIARLLMEEGYNVDFPDLCSTANYDIHFAKADYEGEIECKSLSPDAGRQIHRRDFYRLMAPLEEEILNSLEDGVHQLLVVTLEARLPKQQAAQKELVSQIKAILTNPLLTEMVSAVGKIERFAWVDIFESTPCLCFSELEQLLSSKFGKNLHVFGPITETTSCQIVMRSEKEDDTSKPIVVALKKASQQLTGQKPGLIAIQFEEITPQDLVKPSFRRRLAVLALSIFKEKHSQFITGIHFSAYDGLTQFDSQKVRPSFLIKNPEFQGQSGTTPFLETSISFDEFAANLEVDLSDFSFTDRLRGL